MGESHLLDSLCCDLTQQMHTAINSTHFPIITKQCSKGKGGGVGVSECHGSVAEHWQLKSDVHYTILLSIMSKKHMCGMNVNLYPVLHFYV